ncbi:MAG: hypothetical protein MUO82_04220 [Candidatus Thermoplasmatota archaeon]|nr:hypothetical protein [Candidatus Thermoplasmatota archaeon]
MKNKIIVKMGGILFLIGLILIILSWCYTYPVHLSSINNITFFQFYPLLWPGIVLSLIGLFLVGFYCKNKIVIAICSSSIPLLLNAVVFFYSFITASDAGAARGMFLVFQKTGINSNVIPYFEFPTFFSLNEIIRLIVGVDEKSIAVFSFILYGVLLGLFLFLFFANLKRQYYDSLIPFLLVLMYFIGTFSFINYQWVPQTLALVYFFLLIMISSYLIFDVQKIKWNLMIILIFVPFVLSHTFIPVIFLSFFGILFIKKRYLLPIFLTIFSIYIVVTIYYTTTYLPLYIKTFEQSITGFNNEYTTRLSSSFSEPESLLNQLISFSNRLSVPMVWILGGIGIIGLFLKKRINYILIAIGLSGGIYLAVGLFYSVLGIRAIQFLFIFMTIGFMFFISKWRRLTTILIFIFLILAVFMPMRLVYNDTHFQIDEEANACNFLAKKIINVTHPKVAIGQVNFGFFTSQYSFLKNRYSIDFALRPGNPKFLYVFNNSIKKNDYILYNSNIGKEIIRFELTKEQLNDTLRSIKYNNKIYDCGTTFILNGIH